MEPTFLSSIKNQYETEPSQFSVGIQDLVVWKQILALLQEEASYCINELYVRWVAEDEEFDLFVLLMSFPERTRWICIPY